MMENQGIVGNVEVGKDDHDDAPNLDGTPPMKTFESEHQFFKMLRSAHQQFKPATSLKRHQVVRCTTIPLPGHKKGVQKRTRMDVFETAVDSEYNFF